MDQESAERRHKVERLLAPIGAFELHPELEGEIERRIAESATKIKFWIISGVLGNVITFGLAAIPSVFYLGQLSSNIERSNDLIRQQIAEMRDVKTSQERRTQWEAAAEQWMLTKGFVPPRQR